MDVLPIPCPKQGHELRKAESSDHRCPYACACGQVILTTTTLVYIEPHQDKTGERAQIVLDMITDAWNEGNFSPYIHTVEFDRRLNQLKSGKSWWKRWFG